MSFIELFLTVSAQTTAPDRSQRTFGRVVFKRMLEIGSDRGGAIRLSIHLSFINQLQTILLVHFPESSDHSLSTPVFTLVLSD